jgi:hypothetical protein
VHTDGTISSEEVRQKIWGNEAMALDDALLDTATFSEKVFGGGVQAQLTKVVKLQPGQGVMGVFTGYAPAYIKTVDGKEEKQTLMNFISIRVDMKDKPIINVRILGSAQIMQQMQNARPGDTVGVYRGTEPDIELSGGRRVKVYHVAIKPLNPASFGAGLLSQPAGKWGEAYAEGIRVETAYVTPPKALPMSESESEE